MVRTLRFPGPFQPTRLLSLDGSVWLVGGEGPSCVVERIDPATLVVQSFLLPQCPTDYVTAGPGHLYLLVVDYTTGTNNEALHVEIFDTATGRSEVMAPVATRTVGSGLAHMTLAYGDGSIWLYPWGDRVLRLSPSSGAVVGSVGSVTSGGGHAVMVADPTAMWLAEGPGGQGLFRFTGSATTASKVYSVPSPGSLVWVAAAAGRIWAEVATYSGYEGRRTTSRLVALDRSGQVVLESAPEGIGEAGLVEAGGTLWSVGMGMACQGPLLLWRVDPETAKSAIAATLSTGRSCITSGPAQIVDGGGYAFVLDPAEIGTHPGVLYRITP